MSTENNPTGLAYLKTYNALFQVLELLFLLLTFVLIITQPFFLFPAMIFAVAAFIVIWIVTIMYFFCYITASYTKLNNSGENQQNPSESPGESAALLQPTPDNDKWIDAECIIYIVILPFLVVAVIMVAIHLPNVFFLVAMIFGWMAVLFYLVHVCFLVRRSKGDWPHAVVLKSLSNNKQINLSDGNEAVADNP